jgi:hypothetical protein
MYEEIIVFGAAVVAIVWLGDRLSEWLVERY